MTDSVQINDQSGNINCDHINVRENMVISCAINHKDNRMGAVMVPYAPMQTIIPTGNGAGDVISTATYSTLVITDDIGSWNSTHVLGSGRAKNQIKVIRISGNSGSAVITPFSLLDGVSITLPGTTDAQQSSVTLLWRNNTWTVIDRSSSLVVIMT